MKRRASLILLGVVVFLFGLLAGGSSAEDAEDAAVKGLRFGMSAYYRYGEADWVDEIYLPEKGVTFTTGSPPAGTKAIRGKSQTVQIWEALERCVDPEDVPPAPPFLFKEIRVPKKLAEEIVALADLQAKADREAHRISKKVHDAGLLPRPAESGK